MLFSIPSLIFWRISTDFSSTFWLRLINKFLFIESISDKFSKVLEVFSAVLFNFSKTSLFTLAKSTKFVTVSFNFNELSFKSAISLTIWVSAFSNLLLKLFIESSILFNFAQFSVWASIILLRFSDCLSFSVFIEDNVFSFSKVWPCKLDTLAKIFSTRPEFLSTWDERFETIVLTTTSLSLIRANAVFMAFAVAFCISAKLEELLALIWAKLLFKMLVIDSFICSDLREFSSPKVFKTIIISWSFVSTFSCNNELFSRIELATSLKLVSNAK